MKKTILSIIILLMCAVAFSQTYQMRATSAYALHKNTNKTDEVHDIQILVTINTTDGVVSIDNNHKSVYYLKTFKGKTTQKDKDGDEYIRNSFNAVDEENIPCECTLDIYTHLNLIRVIADYSDLTFLWSGKVL